MIVVIEIYGKQYRTRKNDILKIKKNNLQKRNNINVKSVLALENNDKILLGRPYIQNIEVEFEMLRSNNVIKLIVFKKKRRQNYKRKLGIRKTHVLLKVIKILTNGNQKSWG